jgi:hypothetical protein
MPAETLVRSAGSAVAGCDVDMARGNKRIANGEEKLYSLLSRPFTDPQLEARYSLLARSPAKMGSP